MSKSNLSDRITEVKFELKQVQLEISALKEKLTLLDTRAIGLKIRLDELKEKQIQELNSQPEECEFKTRNAMIDEEFKNKLPQLLKEVK